MESMMKLVTVWSLFLVVSLAVATVEAQFFTKSSKSIPRMGRRSDESLAPSISSRRALIDYLIDEYGPYNLVKALESNDFYKVEQASLGSQEQKQSGSDEVALSNDQPIDWNPSNVQFIGQPSGVSLQDSIQVSSENELSDLLPKHYKLSSFDRDERSPNIYQLSRRSPASIANADNAADINSGSLAMRALNTERYLRHLASGQPLMPFNRFVALGNSKWRPSGDGLSSLSSSSTSSSSNSQFKQQHGNGDDNQTIQQSGQFDK